MLRLLLGSALVVGLAAGASRAPAADDAYAIKLYKSKKGDRIEHENTETGTSVVTLTIMGTANKQEVKNTKKEAYTEEVFERPAGAPRPTKLARAYTAAEKTAGDKTTKQPYAGKTIRIEKAGDKYTFSIDGKAVEPDDIKDVSRSFDTKSAQPQTEDFVPAEPVKVGAGWTVPGEKTEKLFASLGAEQMKIDAKKSAITGKLLKAYKKDGAQFGVMEFTITVVITEVDIGGQFAKAADGSKMVIKATVDACIDGSTEAEEATLDVAVDITAEIPNGTLAIRGKSTGRETSRLVKK